MKTTTRPEILMVTARYFPSMGGIETHVYEVGKRLVKDGLNITILTTTPQTSSALLALPREEMIEGVKIMRVPTWPRTGDYYFSPQISTLIKKGSWSLIHCQGCHTFVPPMAMLAARTARIPYILTFHTGGHSSPLRKKIRTTQWRLLRPLLAGASQLIGVSRYETTYFQKLLHLPAQKFTLISNGSTLPAPSEPPMSVSDRPLILSVGRLEKYKGHHHLIHALPHIRAWRPDARLLILGSGPYERALREMAQKSGVSNAIDFRAIPASDRRGMAETLSRASLVALLSEYEAHPVAVMEALAMRRPVLVTNTSGLKELADQGFARALALKSSPEEIARAVRLQIEEPIMPPPDLALPTWDECSTQLLSIYDGLLGRQRCVS